MHKRMQAIRFDGFGSYVELPAGIFGEEANATIEVWVKWEYLQRVVAGL